MVALKYVLEAVLPSCFKSKNEILPSEDKIIQVAKQISSEYHRLVLSEYQVAFSSNDLSSNLHDFTLAELKVITSNFSSANFLGKGGFGPVHKGFIYDNMKPGLKAQSVAVKLLDLDGAQGHQEWLAEVVFLGQLRNPHLVKLIGYCLEDKKRLLAYEYMTRGNLENHLFSRRSVCLPWLIRMKIAVGAAKGLAFLHGEEQPVIYGDFMTSSNIFLDSDYSAKLSNFGLAKDGPEVDNTRVMVRYGYAAPEYIMTGRLTSKSDVYSFGVVLLELITGRRAMGKNRPVSERNLVTWARPRLKDMHKLVGIMDLRLDGHYSIQGAMMVAALAYQCVSYDQKSRPTMSNVVKALEPILDLTDM